MSASHEYSVPWARIDSYMHTHEGVQGGNTAAGKGMITLETGEKLFIKAGVDDNTKGWIRKEIAAYTFLQKASYFHAAQLMSANDDHTSLALEALDASSGWDWTASWTLERLRATLSAMDDLAAIIPEPEDDALVTPILTDADNGWRKLSEQGDCDNTRRLEQMLDEMHRRDVLEEIGDFTDRASSFVMQHDTLVHHDVRADNCPWRASTQEVKLVDWNWLQMGDRRVDLASTLVHTHIAGLDVVEACRDRLDADALHWMAGFWIQSASKPIWVGGPKHFRAKQLIAGVTALDLAQRVRG